VPVDEILTQVTKEHESIADTHSLTSRDSSLHSFDTFDSSADNLDTLRRHSYIPGTVSDPANWTSLSSLNSLSTNQESALFSAQVIYDYTVMFTLAFRVMFSKCLIAVTLSRVLVY